MDYNNMVMCPSCFCWRPKIGDADDRECVKCKKKNNEKSDIISTEQLYNMRQAASKYGNTLEFKRISKCLAMRGELEYTEN